ncbi:cellulase family glycosylhydrolase [Mangrovibacterium diazotrophicum]|uniref:Aryl-phospho-beta-D-glucosidase BglC (GH1 family) n=1 Tax=Mangrovibacterium diazotrophicum TaxID=1261403 RepID=A0A419W9F6_9BACT|nr:cellulase family glycosylhydrolase [Mangrovibacterium diazotrophicum]RKD92032.1 aryl-phospho-beta-D-glucosidase BglC (GH1 family) [Mangrovibacterium diazotrophicum]
MTKDINRWIYLLLVVLSIAGCSSSNNGTIIEEPEATLMATPTTFSFTADGGTASFDISSNTTWRINFNSTDWCKPSIQSTKGNATVTLTAEANSTTEERNLSMTLTADGAETVTLQCIQAAAEEEPVDPESPDTVDPDMTGMDSNAEALAAKLYLGWNLGNTLESIGSETAWGNPKATSELIQAVKTAGFNAVRVPCAWNQYLEDQTTYKIKDTWLARVKEVVDYCVSNNVYVILNIHWDGGWLENNCTVVAKDGVNAKQAAIWKQIAKYFRDYDEYLLFAGANEPNADTQEQADVLKTYMQTFVDVVRATGGKNTYRNLIIPGPNTDIDKTNDLMSLPTDATANRLMAEVHYYSPWNFCGLEADASWGKMFYFWGADNHMTDGGDRNASWGEEDYVDAQFKKMKTKFVDQGVPVILGEFAPIRRDLSAYDASWQQKHDDSRAWFSEYVVKQAKAHGMVPFYWDNGPTSAGASGIFDRTTNAVGDQQLLDGLTRGAAAGTYPF